MIAKQNLKQHMEETKTLTPTTPLSNRHYLNNREVLGTITPVSSATQTVSQLHSMLIGYNDKPSQALQDIFGLCCKSPEETVTTRIQDLGDKFVAAYSKPMDADLASEQTPIISIQSDFAKKRLELAVTLYYKVLENIMKREKKRLQPSGRMAEGLASLLNHEIFHVSLFAACIEIVLYSYNSKRIFPWIIDVLSDFKDLKFQGYHFYKVIELVIRDEENLSRSVVKHLNLIEEEVLQSLAWKSDSALWALIESSGVPSCQDVAIQSTNGETILTTSPMSAYKKIKTNDPYASPVPTERFITPSISFSSNAKRRLFDASSGSGQNGSLTTSAMPPSNQANNNQLSVHLAIPTTNSSEMRIIQIPGCAFAFATESSPVRSMDPPKTKQGPVGLFFRKVYYLAYLRLKDLCDRLNVCDEELRKKIWTCFELSLKSHTILMRDRHLDQLLMCAIVSFIHSLPTDILIQPSFCSMPHAKLPDMLLLSRML